MATARLRVIATDRFLRRKHLVLVGA